MQCSVRQKKTSWPTAQVCLSQLEAAQLFKFSVCQIALVEQLVQVLISLQDFVFCLFSFLFIILFAFFSYMLQ